MIKIRYIYFSPRYMKRWDSLSEDDRRRTHKAIELFRRDPFHPSLRLHRLKGKMQMYWSISISRKIRIIFRLDGEAAFFSSVGSHAVYGKP